MRRFVCAVAALALLSPLPAAAQVQSGAGISSFNGRRGAIVLQSSDIPGASKYVQQGNGVATVFTFPVALDVTKISVAVGGAEQVSCLVSQQCSYSASSANGSTTITFGQAPPPNTLVVVTVGAIAATVPVIAPVQAPEHQVVVGLSAFAQPIFSQLQASDIGGLGALATLSTVPIANGGTGATNPAAALQALGGLPLAGGTLTGSILNGPPPSFVQLSGQPVTATVPLLTFVQGTQTAGVSGQGYATPMVYLERTDSTTSTATTSDWGNPRLSPMLLLQGTVGVGNVNNPNGLAIQMEAPYPDVAGFNYPMVGESILVQCNPSSGKCRDMDAMNLVAAWISGSKPTNMGFIEGDHIPVVSANGIRPSQGGDNFFGFWAQAAGTNTASGPAFEAGNSTSNNGWYWGFLADGNFFAWGAYINNTINAPSAGGIFVNTAYAGAGGTIASFGSNGTPYMTINGAGTVNFTGSIAMNGTPGANCAAGTHQIGVSNGIVVSCN